MRKPMMVLMLVLVALSVTGCKSEEEKRAEWIAECSVNDFTPKQCSVLYMLAKGKADADSTADSNLAIGMATGMAVSGGSRR